MSEESQKLAHFVEVMTDDKSRLVSAAQTLRFDTAALRLGASFSFDGVSSRLATVSVEASHGSGLPGAFLLWWVPKAGFLLPTKIAAGAEFLVLQGDPDAAIVMAGTSAPRVFQIESGRHLRAEEDCWLWLSPVESEISFVTSGISLPSAIKHTKGSSVQQVRVFETSGLPIAETVERTLSEADRFECFPKNPTNELFDPWRDSEYEDDDRYQVLQMRDMSAEFRRFMGDWLTPLFGSSNFYFQINRYERGDHVLPHRDSLQQGLMMLTDGRGDGLCLQSGQDVVRVQDRAGRIVLCDKDAWHWVDPVRNAPRFTLVIIPAFTPKISILDGCDKRGMVKL